MNTYKISWTETVIKSVTVEGNTREEAWEAFQHKQHSRIVTSKPSKTSPGIGLLDKRETNET